MSVGAIRAGRAMVEIFADSSMLSRGLATAQGKMARFAATLRRLGTAQIVVGVTFAAPLAAAVVTYSKLEQKINTVRALTGASGKEMAVLSDQIRKIGLATGMAFTDIADAMGELARAGVKVKDLGAATQVIADFSRAAGIDMARAANIGVEILTQFGLSMEHLPRVADVLQEMANATVSTVEELSDGFRYAGQSANMFGLSLEQTAAAIAYLQQSGLSASTAGTSLNQMLLQVVQNLDKLEGAVGGLRGADGEFLPFAQILAKLQAFIKNLPGPERLRFLNEMFDIRGMRGAEALLKNIEAWLQLTAQAQASTGATARKAAEMAKAFVVAFEKMRNGVSMFGYAIGEALDKDLRFAFEAIGRSAATLAEFVKKNQGVVQALARTAAALVASGVAFFSVGMAIQLALFSMEGFLKVASGLAAAVAGPFKMVASVAMMLAGAFSSVAGRMLALAGLGGRIVGGLFAPVIAGVVSTIAYFVRLLAVNAALLTVLPATFANIAAIAAGTVRLTAVFAAGALAQPVLALAAAFAAAAIAATVLQRIARAGYSVIEALGQGLPKIWQGFADRAKAVWPEMIATAAAGWAGVTAALQSGDLGLAWQVFTESARAAFAQIMIIIGPAADDAAEILFDIGRGLYEGIRWAVTAVSDLIWGITEIARPVFDFLAGMGEALLGGFSSAFGELGGLFTALGQYAEEGGNRIYEALSAGDIVAAWSAAITAIRKMMIDLGSWYDQYVGQPVRLLAVELNNQDRRRAQVDLDLRAGQDTGVGWREFANDTGAILGARTDEERVAATERARAKYPAGSRGADSASAAIDAAAALRREELGAAGVRSPEEQAAERQRQQDAAEAEFQARERDRAARREKAAEGRRAAADKAAARAASSASSAQEARRNRELEQQIDTATKPEEFDAAQKEIDARQAARDKAEADAGIDPGAAAAAKERMDQRREGDLEMIESRRKELAEAVGSGEITPEQANVFTELLDNFENSINEAQTTADALEALNQYNSAAADAAEGFGTQAPAVGEMVPPKTMRNWVKIDTPDAEARRAADATAQVMDNEARAAKAMRLREEAAQARRDGDEAEARSKEEQATSLEHALDEFEAGAMQQRLDQRREDMARQEALRGQAGKAAAGGEQAAASTRLDAIGGFMTKAFDRLGFGSNLSDRQARAAEAAADGIGRLVRMAENGGIFIA